jgi:DUF1009 family protein
MTDSAYSSRERFFVPDAILIVAGKGAYPVELAQGARAVGVTRIEAIAFKGETDSALARVVDRIVWLRLGRLQDVLDAAAATGIRQVVLAGQITPTSLFHVRPDFETLRLLREIRVKNADTLFGRFCEELRKIGLSILPAWQFMHQTMPPPGLLAGPPPSPEQEHDIELGLQTAKALSGLNIGQTVAVKEGVILAVEAFEGTDATIRRAGSLGGAGIVVVKVARLGHDERFDIPVIGTRTLEVLRKVRAALLAVEAGRTIILEKPKVVDAARRQNLTLVAVDAGHGFFAR